jgi:hypothetical protein
MGCYINPKDQTKEEWLVKFAKPQKGPTPVTETEVPICLVDNGLFTAAGVGFDDQEAQAFNHPDGRRKLWFSAKRTDLYDVSDLKDYE